MSDPAGAAPDGRVECTAARDPAVRLFILAAMLIALGLWCFWDSFVVGKYPYPPDGNLSGVAGFYFNHVSGVLLPLAGLVPLVWAVVFLRRVLVADEEGIGYVGKDKLPWDRVDRLDATELKDKGILYLQHGGGRLVLDSWKLANFKALVAYVERHVGPDAAAPPEAVQDAGDR